MEKMVKQKTIKTEISLTGVGLHTGREVEITFKPAPINNGFTFVRKDLEGHHWAGGAGKGENRHIPQTDRAEERWGEGTT